MCVFHLQLILSLLVPKNKRNLHYIANGLFKPADQYVYQFYGFSSAQLFSNFFILLTLQKNFICSELDRRIVKTF